MQLFDELVEAWRYARDGVIAEVENLPENALSKAPDGLPRTGFDLVNHIVESARLMAGELTRPDGDFQRKSYTELVDEYIRPGDVVSSKKDAVELLKRSHAEDEAKFKAAGADRLMEPIRQFNGVAASRMSWFAGGISHEEYHRGQLAMYARLCGETPALTKVIMGESA
jgi:uncharacterized damage-inducible protein DinB